MWTIRKPKRASQTAPQREVADPPNEAVPRFVARQMLMLLRMAHLAGDNMTRMCAVLSPERKATYAHFENIEIKPSFDEVMKLIEISEERGILSHDEAVAIRAGEVRNISNPLPDVGDSVRM